MNGNKSIEILAPSGSFQSVEAAVRQGADAVYIGSLQFSARAYAENFDSEQLKKAIHYCHLHSVKVHMAINTLVSDDELQDALLVAKEAYELGVDAFIIQDLGLFKLIKDCCPDIALHASTQMGVHTPEAAKLLYSLGFERVVLAREMNKSEIAEVVNSCPVETEVFVHGALCMCMSGQCYLSAMIGGRSGNRGRCAQPCRLPFKVKNGTGHDLSLKDNCLIGSLCELEKIGVTSAKIEGRMKRPEYAAAAAAACRHTLDKGSSDREELERLRAVFSRSGFTNGYYFSKIGKDMFGTRSKEDVVSATNKVLAELRSEYKDEIQSNDISLKLTVLADKPAELTAVCKDITLTVRGDIPEKAQKVPLSHSKAAAQLSKTGGTAFKAVHVDTVIGEDITLPISCLNAMRRELLSQLEAALTKPAQRTYIEPPSLALSPHKTDGTIKYRASFRSCDIPDCFKNCEFVCVPVFSKPDQLRSLIDRGFNVCAEIPRAFFGLEKRVDDALAQARKIGIDHVYCGNIGAAALAKNHGFSIHGGFGLNVFNSQAVDFYKSLGLCDTELSFELCAKQINNISSDIGIGIVGYGYLPLMITRNCPNKNGNGCKSCGGKSVITDRLGNNFTLMCQSGCTEMLNCKPLIISDKLSQFETIDFVTLRFTFESAHECERIFNNYLHKNKPHSEYTGGLYFRGVE